MNPISLPVHSSGGACSCSSGTSGPIAATATTVTTRPADTVKGRFWNMFAFTTRCEDECYAFLTDVRSVVAVDATTYEQLTGARGGQVPADLDGDELERFRRLGLVRDDPPARQFAAVMRRGRTAAPREYELLHIITSYKCNLTCSYCFMLANLDRHPTSRLEWEEARRGIDLFFSLPHKPESVIHFYGGEPLLHPQLIDDTLSYIHERYSEQIVAKIITNGTLHEERHLALLQRYDFDLSVSMDGDRQAHDVFRLDHGGRSTFDKTVDGIRRFQNIGCNPKILITVGQHNIERLPEVVEFVLSLRPQAIALNFPRELPVTKSLLDDDAMEASYWVAQYGRAVQRCYAAGIPELYMADMLFAFYSGEPVLSPCAACGSQLSIGPGAKVGPCQAFVAAGQFSESIERFDPGADDVAFAPWKGVSKASSRKCSCCPISAICGGDCSFDRYNRTHSLHEPLPLHCDLRLLMAEHLVGRLIAGEPLGFAGAG